MTVGSNGLPKHLKGRGPGLRTGRKMEVVEQKTPEGSRATLRLCLGKFRRRRNRTPYHSLCRKAEHRILAPLGRRYSPHFNYYFSFPAIHHPDLIGCGRWPIRGGATNHSIQNTSLFMGPAVIGKCIPVARSASASSEPWRPHSGEQKGTPHHP